MTNQPYTWWRPKFRVGQIVSIACDSLPFDCEGSTRIPARVLYPREDGTYFLKVGNGYSQAPESTIEGEEQGLDMIQRHQVRVVFFGNGPFALPTLKRLVAKGYDVCAVVTMPDKRAGRGREIRQSLVKEFAVERGIQVLQPVKLDGYHFQKSLRQMGVDIGVVVEFRILPESTFSIPRLGCINLHSSLLPEWRGASPIPYAIKSGNCTTGVTVFRLAKEIDSGDVINNMEIGIGEEDDASTIHFKLRTVGATLVDDAIHCLVLGRPAVPQEVVENDFLRPSYAPKLKKGDFDIPWSQNANIVANHIRALSPYPGAKTTLRPANVEVKILAGHATTIPRGEGNPIGAFRVAGRELLVACRDYMYCVERLQMPGRNVVSATDFINGYHKRGHIFDSRDSEE